MSLTDLKLIAAATIMLFTLFSGLISIGFARRFQKQLEVGDAVANGIFIGAALFHLLPEAIVGFKQLAVSHVYIRTVLLLACSFFFLWIIERVLLRASVTAKQHVHVGVLIIVLSLHAFIAGIALGISDVMPVISVLLIAIIAHKGFETFAFMINIYRQIGSRGQLLILLIFFSLITPMGIALGMMSDTALLPKTDDLLTASFSTIAAGTFLFIGTAHSHYLHKETDSYRQYTRVIATISGIVIMGILGIWI